MRYRVLNRERAPFGLTLGADPQWGRVDDLTGEPVDRYGTDFWIIADKELAPDRIFPPPPPPPPPRRINLF